MDYKKISYSSRIKSVRREKRLQKESFKKKLIVLNKEQRRLGEQIKKLGYEPLVPPVQKGWKRIFVLREDVQQGPRAAFFEKLLTLVNTTQYSDTRQFKKKRRMRGRKVYADREQKLRVYYEYEWSKLKLTPQQAFFFTGNVLRDEKRIDRKFYVFNEPWRFRLKVAPNMITQQRIKDVALERRLHEINYYLERNYYKATISRLLGKEFHFRYPLVKPRYLAILKEEPLYKTVADYYNEK